ncbi:MAG: sigma-70 family RNA polymerase sigma factor [Candidatus Brocadiia bacterium]
MEDQEIKEIVSQAQSGSNRAFEELVKRYQQMVFWLAYRMLGDQGLADSVTQDVFIRVYQSLKRFDINKNFSTWLRQITVNRSVDYLRKYKNRPVSIEQAGDIISRSPEPGKEEEASRIRAMVDELPKHYKTVIVLRDMEGLETKEVSEIIGKPEATVRWRLHQARIILRSKYEKGMQQV